MLTSLCLVCGFGVIALLVYHWKRRNLYRIAAKIPGPKGWPVIGSAYIFFGIKSMEEVAQLAQQVAEDYSSGITKVWICYKIVVVVSEPEYIEALLNHPSAAYKADLIYKQIAIATGCGIFSRNGDKWLRLRKEAVKLFNPKSIEGLDGIIENRLKKLCDIFDIQAEKGEKINIVDYINLYSLDLIIETTIGLKTMNETETNSLNYPALVDEALTEVVFSTISLSTFCNLSPGFKLKKICDKLTRVTAKLMKTRVASTIQNRRPMEKKYADAVFSTGKVEGLSFHETCKLANDILIAGSDTSSSVIGGTLFMIAIHQHVQDKIYEELKEIFGDSDRAAEKVDLDNMKYLDMCLNEGLRHFGAMITGRQISSNVQVGDYLLPEGSAVILAHHYVSISPKYWEKPNSFYPEHFTPEAKQSRPKGAFLPFNSGPRSCPGKLYSMQVMKRTISTIVRRYKMTADVKYDEVSYKFHLLRVPVNPLIRLSRRI